MSKLRFVLLVCAFLVFTCESLQFIDDFEKEFSYMLDIILAQADLIDKGIVDKLLKQYAIVKQLKKKLNERGKKISPQQHTPIKLTNFLRF